MNTTSTTYRASKRAAIASLIGAAAALTLAGTLASPADASAQNARGAEYRLSHADQTQHNARVAEYLLRG